MVGSVDNWLGEWVIAWARGCVVETGDWMVGRVDDWMEERVIGWEKG